jgi:hypothetical protein
MTPKATKPPRDCVRKSESEKTATHTMSSHRTTGREKAASPKHDRATAGTSMAPRKFGSPIPPASRFTDSFADSGEVFASPKKAVRRAPVM